MSLNKKNLLKEIPFKLPFALLFLGLILIFLSGYYYDLVLITEHSLKFWDILFNDGIAGLATFYSSAESITVEGHPSTEAPYNIFVYILLAVLNIPTILLRGDVQHLADAYPALLWSKFVILMLFGFAVYCFYKLLDCFEFSTEQKAIAVFIFCSSIFAVSSTVYIGQIDIGGVAFTMLGLRGYLKNDRKQMYIFFMIACLFKLFALFIFIPLMLLREKRVFYFLRDVVFVMLPFILTDMVLFAILDPSRVSQSRFISMLTNNNFSTNDGASSYFIVAYIVISALCYIYKPSRYDDRQKCYTALYACLAVFASFFIFSRIHPYWSVVIVPYISIILIKNNSRQKFNIIAETIGSLSLIITQMIYAPNCFGTATSSRFTLRLVEGRVSHFNTTSVFTLLFKENYDNFLIIFLSIFVGCFIAILIVNFPTSSYFKDTETCDAKQVKQLIYSRALINIAFMFIPAIIYIINIVVIAPLQV